MRSWLKLLAYWETETTVPKERWGLRLYQSFPEGSQPRKIADQVPMNDLLTVQGYGLVLSALLAKHRPYLEVAGPTSIDHFLYHGERAKGESFANYIAAKKVARQEMESHLQERLCERVAGRVLLRHANLTEFQREMMALKEQGQMWTFDQVITLLRPLDRPELLAQAAGAELGVQAAKHCPVLKLDGEQGQEGEEEESEQEYSDDEVMELADGEYMFEDKEYTKDEALYIQAYHSAYADVRRDLQNRRKEAMSRDLQLQAEVEGEDEEARATRGTARHDSRIVRPPCALRAKAISSCVATRMISRLELSALTVTSWATSRGTAPSKAQEKARPPVLLRSLRSWSAVAMDSLVHTL